MKKFDEPWVLFALRRENTPFLNEFGYAFDVPSPGSPCTIRSCGSKIVAETGVGQANVARVLDWLLAKPKIGRAPNAGSFEPRLIVFAGFAGALMESQKIGDIIVAGEVVDEHGHRWPTTWPAQRQGRLLTVDVMTATPADRRRLAEQHQAIAVEMESAHFAARCTKAGIPFGCVRAISDVTTTTLSPALTAMLSGGAAPLWRVLMTLARHPAMLPELLRLARDTRVAAVQLGRTLDELLASPDDPNAHGNFV